eukprot:IDg21658t1
MAGNLNVRPIPIWLYRMRPTKPHKSVEKFLPSNRKSAE